MLSRKTLMVLGLASLFLLGGLGAVALGAGETIGTNTATAIATACKGNLCNTVTATHTNTYTIPTVTVTTGTTAPAAPDTSITSVACGTVAPDGNCIDGNNDGGNTVTVSYTVTNGDGANCKLDADPYVDCGPSTSTALWASASCTAHTVYVQGKRSSDGAVDGSPATAQVTVEPAAGCGTPSSYPAGVTPYLGGTFLGNSFGYQTNLNHYDALELRDDNFGSFTGHKIAYMNGQWAIAGHLLGETPDFARQNGWLLHNADGTEAQWCSSTDSRLTDPGNVSYQNYRKQKVLDYLSAHPDFSGIRPDSFDDNLWGDTCHSYPVLNQNNVVLYNTQADYANAQIAYADNVFRAIKNAGYVVIPNGRSSSTTISIAKNWLSRYAADVTGGGVEYWLQKNDLSLELQDGIAWSSWNNWRSYHQYANSLGIGFMPLNYLSTANASGQLNRVRYILASYLLDWNGVPFTSANSGTGFDLFGPNNAGSFDIWNSEFAKDLGLPTAQAVALTAADANGAQVWARQLSKGYVIVNPSVASQTVSFAGTSYTIASGDAVLHVGP